MNRAEETAALLSRLIRNQCVNDGTPDSGRESISVATLREFFGEVGRVFEPLPGRQSVLYRVAGRDPDAPRLMLMGHLDVVPADPVGWEQDPFGGNIRDGFVWGRGAVDMLNLTAAMAMVFRDYLSGAGPQPAGDLLFLGVADEEAGGKYGAHYLTANHWAEVGCEYVLNEVGYPSLDFGTGSVYPVNVAEKGPYWRVLESAGVPGHGSAPYGTENALLPLARVVGRLESAGGPPIITNEWRAFVEGLNLADPAPWLDPDRLVDVIDEMSEDSIGMARYLHACTHLTISPNVLRSGVKFNMIPDRGRAEIDFRALPGQDERDIDDLLRSAIGPDREGITVQPVMDHPASSSPAEGPLWEAIAAAFSQIAGGSKVVPMLTPVTTDLRFFRDRGAVGYGVGLYDDLIDVPEFLGMFHGRNERVGVESLGRTVELLGSTVEGFQERIALEGPQ